MADNRDIYTNDYQRRKNLKGGGISGSAYGIAFIGALIYYIQHATTFTMGVIGFFKAIVWPAILIYKLMEFLKM